MKCILGGRGWVGSTHLGTSWEPQQDLEGRRGFIYTELALIYIRQSAVHMRGGGCKRSHTQGCWDTWFEEPVSFPANQTAGLRLTSGFNCIITSAASHAQKEGVEEEKTSARQPRPRNLIELAD